MKSKPILLVYLVIAFIPLCFGCATTLKVPILDKGQIDRTSNIGVGGLEEDLSVDLSVRSTLYTHNFCKYISIVYLMPDLEI